MKKLLFVMSALAALTLLAPAPGSAYDNIMGIMFTDPAAYSVANPLVSCTSGTAMGMVPCYVILINSTLPALYGYEFGFTTGGGTHLVANVVPAGTAPIDVGGTVYNHIVGVGIPMTTVNGGATLLATINIFIQSTDAVTITLANAVPSSNILPQNKNLPALLGPDDLIIPAGTATALGSVTGAINGCSEVVGVDEASWDAVKSLYR